MNIFQPNFNIEILKFGVNSCIYLFFEGKSLHSIFKDNLVSEAFDFHNFCGPYSSTGLEHKYFIMPSVKYLNALFHTTMIYIKCFRNTLVIMFPGMFYTCIGIVL